VGVYLHTWSSTFFKGCLGNILLPCRDSIRHGSCWTTLDTEESLFGSIRRPSWYVSFLGQSEDQAELSSYLHLNLFVIILGGSSSHGCFLMIPFCSGNLQWEIILFLWVPFCSCNLPWYHSVLVSFLVDVHLPLWVFFHRKLEVHSYRFPIGWQHLPTIRVYYAIFLGLRLSNVVSHGYVSLGLQSQHYESE
jgi:hypothetical protein